MPTPEIHGGSNVVTPDSTISLLHDIPLDNTYEHTLYFGSLKEQTAYFERQLNLQPEFVKYTFQPESYQRYGNNKLRIQAAADDIYGCNYLWFWNSNFKDSLSQYKNFFAFITSINYINNNVCEIEYELDVIQTYLFDFKFKGTFIEREHVALTNQKPGDYLLPEPVNLGEYVATSVQVIEWSAGGDKADLSQTAVIFEVCDTEDSKVYAFRIGGTMSACRYIVMNPSDTSQICSFLLAYKEKPEAIQSAYVCPVIFLPVSNDESFSMYTEPPAIGSNIIYGASSGSSSFQGTQPWPLSPDYKTPETLDGYEPRNPKLLTYPFCFLGVDNSEGDSLTLRYEYWDYFSENSEHQLRLMGTMFNPVQAVIAPVKYKTRNSNAKGSMWFSQQLPISNWPLCGWANDYYTVWKAQNSVPLANKIGASILNSGLQFATGKVAGGASTLINTLADVDSQNYTASIAADLSCGSASVGNVLATANALNYLAITYNIKAEYAKRIDEFFDVYGYCVNRLGAPNRNVRKYWNYVKTRRANVEGNVPTSALRQICAIHDAGITYWPNPVSHPPGDYYDINGNINENPDNTTT